MGNRVHKKFEIEGLGEKDSLELFGWHAFGQNHPDNSYLKFLKEAVVRCGGLPLALELLGSSLCGRSIDFWEETMRKLKMIPDSEIQGILQISYDSLKDDNIQNLFLTIACFFVGMERSYVTAVLKGCGFYTLVGIQNLIDVCLLSANKYNKLHMHQLIVEMAREIVRQESTNDPGKRTRLWNSRDACIVLQERTGTDKIKGLVLDLHRLVKSSYTCTDQFMVDKYLSHSFPLSRTIDLQTESFKKMHKLQILQLHDVNVKVNFKDFPKNLVMLCWNGFPLRCIPSNFYLEKLVSLDLSCSNMKTIWDGTMKFPELKFLNLSDCKQLTKMPNFAKAPFVERLIFRGCVNLLEVDESIEHLKGLLKLSLKDCSRLRKLPKTINMLETLEEIDLSGCSNLDELPEELGQLNSLKVFYANGIFINQFLSKTISRETRLGSCLSSELRHPIGQSWLTLRKRLLFAYQSWLKPPKSMRTTNFSLAWLPNSLVDLNLENCNLSEDAFPSDLSMFGSLIYLNISENKFCSLPKGIASLPMLEALRLDNCTGIQSLQNLPVNLKSMSTVNCYSLERIEIPQLSRISIYVDVRCCEKLDEIEGVYKIYPINRIDKAIAKHLCLSDLESLANIELDMLNKHTCTKKMSSSLQVLEEDGVLNIFSPVGDDDDDIPNCFSLQSA